MTRIGNETLHRRSRHGLPLSSSSSVCGNVTSQENLGSADALKGFQNILTCCEGGGDGGSEGTSKPSAVWRRQPGRGSVAGSVWIISKQGLGHFVSSGKRPKVFHQSQSRNKDLLCLTRRKSGPENSGQGSLRDGRGKVGGTLVPQWLLLSYLEDNPALRCEVRASPWKTAWNFLKDVGRNPSEISPSFLISIVKSHALDAQVIYQLT